MLPNLSLVMELLENVFTNFIFEKFLSHQALVKGRVTASDAGTFIGLGGGSKKLRTMEIHVKQKDRYQLWLLLFNNSVDLKNNEVNYRKFVSNQLWSTIKFRWCYYEKDAFALVAGADPGRAIGAIAP